MKLAVIGLCGENFLLGGGFTDGLREKGFDLFTISADLEFPWRVSGYKTKEDWFTNGKLHPNYDFHIFSAQKTWGGYCQSEEHAKAVQYGWTPVNVKEILKNAHEYPDAILLTPTQDIVCDFAGIPDNIPVYYYFLGAACWPRWPMNAHVCGLFYGYTDIKQTLRDIYPVQWHGMDFSMFLPNACSRKTWYPKRVDRLEEKTHFLGFMGKTDFDRNTWFSRQLYLNRQKYVNYLVKEYALTFNGFKSTTECREFLQDTFLGLNVSAIGTNMRQFEVPACGALLLQHENMDCEKTGLIDGQNCLMFKDIKELDEKVEWAFANLYDANKIRLNGLEYAKKNTFYDRGRECGDALNTHLTLFKQTETGMETPLTNPSLVSPPG